jgi:hypothetical protein
MFSQITVIIAGFVLSAYGIAFLANATNLL